MIKSVQFIDGQTQIGVWNNVTRVPICGESVLFDSRWRRVSDVLWESQERAHCYLFPFSDELDKRP